MDNKKNYSFFDIVSRVKRENTGLFFFTLLEDQIG